MSGGIPPGAFTGVPVATAIDRVEKAVAEWTAEDELRQFKIAEGVLNTNGIIRAIEGAAPARDVAALQRVALSGEASLRVGIMYRPEPPPEDAAWEAIIGGNGASPGFGDDRVGFGGSESFYDGGMTLRTALTRDAYPDTHDDYHGIARQSPERLMQLLLICNRYHWRVGVHALGDRGQDEMLDALEAADTEKSIKDRGFILIHGSLIRPEQMERAKRLGVRVDFQNVIMWDKAATVDRFLSEATADRAVPRQTLIEEKGLNSLEASADFPVSTINPLVNIHIMVARKDPSGHVYAASGAVTREQALRLHTGAASHYMFEENKKGTLGPGKFAGLAVLSADLMTRQRNKSKTLKQC